MYHFSHNKIKNFKTCSVIINFFKPEFTNICFWYVPKSLEDMDRSSVEFKNKLNSVGL